MKKLLTWIGRFFAFLFALITLVVVGIGIWILFQPSLPESATTLNEEYLISDEYRSLADSNLLKMQKLSEEMGLPSLSVALSIDNKIIWAAAIGYADLKEKLSNNLQTAYRSGSVSKSMAGLAAAKLSEQGKLDLEAPISSYIDVLQDKRWDPTLKQLASHTGGIRHYSQPGHPSFVSEQLSKRHYNSVEESLVIFASDSLLYEPGTGFRYSTHSFTLFSAAMEKGANQPYLEIVRELVWEPAGMALTRADDFTVDQTNRIRPYTKIAARYLDIEGPDPSYKWAGGGILSTPSDLVKMGGAFMQRKILSRGPADSVFITLPLRDGTPNPDGYAMGWRNTEETESMDSEERIRAMHHGGASPGGSTFLLLLPDDNLSIAVMSNLSISNSWPLREMAFKIAAQFRAYEIAKDINGEEKDILNAL
ncbi:MAG: serine hydrolase domain-containing protein [Bacteroidota bacterium]